MSGVAGTSHACGALHRTRGRLASADGGDELPGAVPLALADGALGWVHAEYRVAVLVDVRRSAFQQPWVLAAVERVLSALASGPAAILGGASGFAVSLHPAVLHVSLVACARGTEPMRLLLHGWTIRCGEDPGPLLARAREELAGMSRVTAVARASGVAGSSRDRNLIIASPTAVRRTREHQLHQQRDAGAIGREIGAAGGGSGASGVAAAAGAADTPRAPAGARRTRGLAGCLQQGLWTLSSLPGGACPAIALVTDGTRTERPALTGKFYMATTHVGQRTEGWVRCCG